MVFWIQFRTFYDREFLLCVKQLRWHHRTSEMNSEGRQQRSSDYASVETVFTSDDSSNTDTKSGPSESDGSSLQNGSLMSPPPRQNHNRKRPVSLTPRPSNRLSLVLPISASQKDLFGATKFTPAVSNPSTRQASPVYDPGLILSPSEPGGFLVALAAQERRVLELKEELHRAESDLKKLKRQWAVHEAGRNLTRSRPETKHVELLPMQPVLPGASEEGISKDDEVAAKRSEELERRKAILLGMAKDSRRKVITGGHTRALSLLSPIRTSYTSNLANSSVSTSKPDYNPADSRVPDAIQDLPKSSLNKVRHSYQDSATIGVKQIAEDIKSGLWSFMEDLRQATVGEEAIKGPSASTADLTLRASSKKGGRPSPILGGASPQNPQFPGKSPSKSRARRMGTATAPAAIANNTQQSDSKPKPSIVTGKTPEATTFLDDDWSNWDSPVSTEESGRWSNSTALSSQDAGSTSR